MTKRDDIRKALQHAELTPEEIEGHLAIYDDQQETEGLAAVALNIADKWFSDTQKSQK